MSLQKWIDRAKIKYTDAVIQIDRLRKNVLEDSGIIARIKSVLGALRTGRFKRQMWAGLAILFLAFIEFGKPIDIVSDFAGAALLGKDVAGEVVIVQVPEQIDVYALAPFIAKSNPRLVLISEDKNESDSPDVIVRKLSSFSDGQLTEHQVNLPIEWWQGSERIVFNQNVDSEPLILSSSEKSKVTPKTVPINYLNKISSLKKITLKDMQVVEDFEPVFADKIILIAQETELLSMNTRGETNTRATPTQVIALSIETALAGNYTIVDDFTATFIVSLCLLAILKFYQVRIWLFVAATGISLIVFSQLLRPLGLHVEISSSIISLIILSIYTADKRNRENSFHSNLRSIRALTDAYIETNHALIAAKVKSFRPFAKGMPEASRIRFVESITHKLEFLSGKNEIYEIEPGTYVWTCDEFKKEKFFEQVQSGKMLIESPIETNGRRFQPTITFGIDLDSSETLTNRVEDVRTTVEEAEQNKLRWLVSDSARSFAMQAELDLIPAILPAIENGEIFAAYQAKVNIKTGEVAGFEALARWKHPTRGFISPEVFVRLAEDHGKIEELTRFMIQSALNVSKTLDLTIPISVNVQPVSLTNDVLIGDVRNLLRESGQPANLLTLEITETNSMAEDKSVMERLHALDALGVGLSIDDFGTGYSTIDYIRQIPAKELKLDRQFMNEIQTSDRNKRLLQTTIDLGHAVGLTVVVEGVEELPEVELLKTMGADIVQGYIFSRPVTPSGLLDHLNDLQNHEQELENFL